MSRVEIDPLTGMPKFTDDPIVLGRGGGIPGGGGSSTAGIPEYDTDPVSPSPEDAWVLKSTGAGGDDGGLPIGLLLSLTYAGSSPPTTSYQFSYRTLENTTIRTTLS